MDSVTIQHPKSLYSIFFMEDDEVLGADIVEVLIRDFPGSCVEWAQTIEQGLKKLEIDTKFDVAVSDIRVPMRKGDSPMAHDEVAEKLRSLNVPTIFITSWRDSDDVRLFLRKRTLSDPTTLIIEKRGPFSRELCKQIRLLFVQLASSRVGEMICRFFTPTHGSGTSGTARLIQLSTTVTAYWPYLEPGIKGQIIEQFNVTDLGDDGLQLSLRE